MTQHKTTFKRSVAILMTMAMVLSQPTGITMPRQAQAAGYGLNNPTTDSKGVTTWDCVYFGNYWQGATPTPTAPPFSTPIAPHTPTPSPFSTPVAPHTPTPSPYWVPTARPTVTPELVSAKIILATPTAHSKKVVGKKIMMKEAGNVTPTPEPVITPKPTVQPDPTPTSKVSPTPASNNFKIGSIKWRVLSVDGNDAFLMADQSLDAEPYNNSDASVTWSECTLRSWLNGYDSLSNKAGIDYRNNNFIDSAFTNKEKYAIMQTKVSNGDDSDYGGIIGGEDTRDKVYLLSMAEISEESYGFNENFNIESYARMTHDTAYTIWKRGGNYRDIWWLRTAIQGNGAARIYEDGSGHAVANMWPKLGVRPVLHLDLSNTDLWSYAGTVSSEGESVTNGSFVGTLRGYTTSNRTATLDNREITVSSEIEDEDVINLLANHTTRLVAVTLENGVITQITAAENILKPTIEIQPEVSEIVYEHSKFSKKKFDLNLVIKCDVKYPYSLEQVLSAAGEDSGLAVQISKVTLDSQFADSGSIPYYLKDGIFDSKDVSYEKEPNLSLALGETQTISLTAYLKDDYIPENVSNATTFTAQLNDDATTRVNKTVNIANMDKAKKIAQTKQSVSANAPEMNKINTILNGTQAAFDDTKLREYLTDNEVKAVTAQVNNWIYTSNALNSIITDDSENGLIKQLLKKSNLSKEALADKVFEKLGISQAKGMLTGGKSYTGTLKFEATDKNTGKDIVIVFTTNMTFYAFNGSQVSYGGFGTISYKIQKQGFNVKSSKTDLKCEKNGNGVGVITYANYDSFVSSLKKIMEKQIHGCYSKIYGKGIDEISDELLSGTFRKIVVGKYGSASEMVYTGLKYAATGYTEEDAKKSVKDVTIILAKGMNEKKTKVEVHCPVDVSVYDNDGNLCAQIVNDQVVAGYDDVSAYVDNDAKYLLLPDDDYVIEYSGNDDGTMTCNIEEYENDEVVKSLTYENIPLSSNMKYNNFLEAGRRQALALYNPNNEEGDGIAPAEAEGFEPEVIEAEKLTLNEETLELQVDKSYMLQEAIEPYNTTDSGVTWESSNEQVALVDETGLVQAVGVGNADIVAKSQDGKLSAVCQVKVTKASNDNEPSATPTVSPTAKPTGKPTARPTVTPGANVAKNPTQSSAAPNTSAQKLRKGQLVKDTKTKVYYKILSITSSGGTVAYVKPVGKKSKSITIAASTVLDGHTFKVVAVSAKAYKGCSKLQKVTIGKNITSIGKNAFAGCKKLKKITIKSTKLKSSSIGKNAFKGTAKKLTVKVPKKQYKVYKKFLKKKGNGMLKVIK